MSKRLLILFGLPTIDIALIAQTKEYKLKSRTDSADFNYSALYMIDYLKSKESLREVFNPVPGNYTVYLFIASFEGLSFTNEKQNFNDILIVKTNDKQVIVDAYQFTLEWAEPPLSYDLYKMGKNGLVLTDRFSIDKMKFQRVDYYNETDRDFTESGMLLF